LFGDVHLTQTAVSALGGIGCLCNSPQGRVRAKENVEEAVTTVNYSKAMITNSTAVKNN